MVIPTRNLNLAPDKGYRFRSFYTPYSETPTQGDLMIFLATYAVIFTILLIGRRVYNKILND